MGIIFPRLGSLFSWKRASLRNHDAHEPVAEKHPALPDPKQPPADNTPLILALEPRYMFDGAGILPCPEMVDDIDIAAETPDPVATDATTGNADDLTTPLEAFLSDDTPAPVETETAPPPTQAATEDVRQVVIIDSNVDDAEVLTAGASPNADVYVLTEDRSAVTQITEILAQYEGLEALHVVSHGGEGFIRLGNETLSADNLDNYTTELTAIGAALGPDGDILLYGCDVARDSGTEFIQAFAEATDADVAASDDPTGAADLGGDWTLEAATGQIESAVVFDSSAVVPYQYILAPTVQTITFESYSANTNLVTDTQDPSNLTINNPSDTDSGLRLSVETTGGTGVTIDIRNRYTPANTWQAGDDDNDMSLQVARNGDLTIDTASFSSSDGGEFKLTSMQFGHNASGDLSSFTAEAWRDGSLVGSQEMTTSGGTMNVTDLTFDSNFNNIDEFRFDLDLFRGRIAFDDIVIAAAIPNETPAFSNLDGDTVSWAGVSGSVTLESGGDAVASDTELDAADDWSGGSLTVQRSGTAVTTDQFDFDVSGASFTVDNGNLLDGNTDTFATFTATNGVLTVNFVGTGVATPALIDEVVSRVTYQNDTPAGDADIEFTLSDGSDSTTATVTVEADDIYVNDAGDTADADRNTITLREAIGTIAAGQTGSQTIRFDANTISGNAINLGSNLAVEDGLTIDFSNSGDSSITGSQLQLAGSLVINTGSGENNTIASVIADGTGALTKTGAGTLTLSGTNTYTGTTTLSSGTFVTDEIGASSELILDGGTLSAASAAGFNESIAVTVAAGGGYLNLDNGGITFAGTVSGSGDLTVETDNGSRKFELTQTNNGFSGDLTFNNGVLEGNADNSFGTGALIVNGGKIRSGNASNEITLSNDLTLNATLKFSGSNEMTFSGGMDLGGTDKTIDNASTADMTFSGVVDNGNLVVNSFGTGAVILSGTNTNTNISVTRGTLSVASDDNLGSGVVTVNASTNGKLVVTGTTTIDNEVSIGATGGIIEVAAGTTTTMSGTGIVSGSGALTKAGDGILSLSGTNTHTGSTTVSAGTLQVSGGAALSDAATTSVDASATLTVTGSETIGSLSGAGDVGIAASQTLTAGDDDEDTTFSGVLSGDGSFAKSGTGTLTLSGTNLHAGGTTVSGGTLSIASDDNLGSGAVTLANGATLAITADTDVDNGVSLTGDASISVDSAINATASGVIPSQAAPMLSPKPGPAS